jgi:hypothetical protein
MIRIDYPPYKPSIRKEGDQSSIFDGVRKRWVRLTPEEWVRQNFIQVLLQVMGYPPTLLSIEKEIKVGELRKRYDIVVHGAADTLPWLLVECKQREEDMGPSVLEQALRYHITVPARYIVLTNGHYTYGWENKEGALHDLSSLPAWPF